MSDTERIAALTAAADTLARQCAEQRRVAERLRADFVAMSERAAELAARVSDLERRETTASIAAWQNETFGSATTTLGRTNRSDFLMDNAMWHAMCAVRDDPAAKRPNLSRAIRAAEELAELIETLVADDGDPKACEEVADIQIVLAGIPAIHGKEQADLVDTKMATNRARWWATTGDGHGQHVKEQG